jgi:hypothetical protein
MIDPRALSFRARLFWGTLVLFVALVALRLHGSSIALAAKVWAPEAAMQHFVASPLLERLSPAAQDRWRAPLLAEPRYIRIDEWANEGTLYSLMQLAHEPRFPVVNRNVGDGQNMLVLPWAPVLHPTMIARPMTWGYLLLGAEHGLAWAWWSQLVLGFVGLYALFEILVPRRPWLGVLGAAWFCGSAYVAFWSLWPAYVVGVGVLALVFAYHLLTSTSRAAILALGVGLGTSFAAFCMQLYAPWLVPLGLVFIGLFAALSTSRSLWHNARQLGRLRGVALGLGVSLAAGLLVSFYVSTADALGAFAHSDYPGDRRSAGGDCPGWRLFGGLYNVFSKDFFPAGSNPSEAAGFFLLFPAVAAAALVSRNLRARLGLTGWTLLGMAGALTYYCVAPIPEWLATVTLLAHAPGYRAQIALGLVSIVLSVYVLARASERSLEREARVTAAVTFVACAVLYAWQGAALEQNLHYFEQSRRPAWSWIALVSGLAALLATLTVLGRARRFSALLVTALVITSFDFNPLSVGFPDWRTSELGQAIANVAARDEASDDRRPLWLAYGGPDYPNIGSLVQLSGQRSLSGVYYYPQVELWQPLDPSGSERFKYNRFATVRLDLERSRRRVRFRLQSFNVLRVAISPGNPVLREMGARYVLTFGDQPGFSEPRYKLLYRSARQSFAIWRLPDEQ